MHQKGLTLDHHLDQHVTYGSLWSLKQKRNLLLKQNIAKLTLKTPEIYPTKQQAMDGGHCFSPPLFYTAVSSRVCPKWNLTGSCDKDFLHVILMRWMQLIRPRSAGNWVAILCLQKAEKYSGQDLHKWWKKMEKSSSLLLVGALYYPLWSIFTMFRKDTKYSSFFLVVDAGDSLCTLRTKTMKLKLLQKVLRLFCGAKRKNQEPSFNPIRVFWNRQISKEVDFPKTWSPPKSEKSGCPCL